MKRHSAIFKRKIVYGISSGNSQREVAKSLGVHQSTISRHARKPDVTEMIQEEEQKILQEWNDRLQRIKQDPDFQTRTEEVCRQALWKSINRMTR